MFVAVISFLGSSIVIGQSLTVSQMNSSTSTTTDISTYQSYLLSFLGQQAIAHAAEIFATLTAAFAFATGFKHKKTVTGTQLYVLVLTVLFTWSIYAFFRAYYYGVLSSVVLNGSPKPSDMGNLTAYWSFVAYNATRSNQLLGFAGIGGTIQSLSLSWALGCITAVAIVTYLPSENVSTPQKFGDTFTELYWWFRAAFWFALVEYWTEVTIVPYFSQQIGIVAIGFVISLVPLVVFRCWNWHARVIPWVFVLIALGLGSHVFVVLLHLT